MKFLNTICIVSIFTLSYFSNLLVSKTDYTVWYNELNKFILTPPNYTFSIVWFCLYTLLGCLFAFLITQYKTDKLSLKLFLCNLAGIIIWSPLFFAYKQTYAACVCLALMCIISVFLLQRLYDIYYNTSWHLYFLPYILWIHFALILNIAICVKN